MNRLSALMGERRMSIAELRRRTGISYSTLHDLYHDRVTRLDFATLEAVCEALDCDVGDVLRRERQTQGRNVEA